MSANLQHRAKFGKRRLSKPRPNAPGRTPQILTLIFSLLIIAFAISSVIARDALPQLLHDLAIVMIPWIFITLLVVVFSMSSWRKAGGLIRKAWDDSPHMHCEKRIGIDIQAFRLIDAQARYELNWEILAGEEGDTIFVLLTGGVFYIVPKRVLSPAQSEYIIDRLGLRPPQARSGGFPVLPANLVS